jgi:hypothetical protein
MHAHAGMSSLFAGPFGDWHRKIGTAATREDIWPSLDSGCGEESEYRGEAASRLACLLPGPLTHACMDARRSLLR